MSVRLAVGMVAVCLAASSFALAQSTGTIPQTEQESGQGAAAGAGSSPPMTASEQQAKTRLERAGYTQVRNVNAGAEVTSAKAVKDGKEVDIIIDTFGKIIAEPAR